MLEQLRGKLLISRQVPNKACRIAYRPEMIQRAATGFSCGAFEAWNSCGAIQKQSTVAVLALPNDTAWNVVMLCDNKSAVAWSGLFLPDEDPQRPPTVTAHHYWADSNSAASSPDEVAVGNALCGAAYFG